jgi:hypothetical protein
MVFLFPLMSIATEEIIKVPVFEIEVTLTNEAREKIQSSGETIKGAIYFDGNGTPLPNIKTAPFRDVFLGKYEFELEKEGVIKISDATVSMEAYSRLDDQNYFYFVNVYSGRRVFKNNVLRGGYADGRFEDLKAGKKIQISCGL